MKQSQARLRALEDNALPALPTILGSDADELLGVVASSVGGRLISTRPVQVHWQPGRALTVVHDARIAWKGRKATQERLVVATGSTVYEGAMVLEQGDVKVGVWTLDSDPRLPGLAVALDSGRMRSLLDSLAAPSGDVSTRLRAYRPARRAVVEVNAGRTRLFVKVVRPSRVEDLQACHALLSKHLPVPYSHGWSSEYGLIVLEAMPGSTLRDLLYQRHAELPDPMLINGLLDRMVAPDGAQTAYGVLASLDNHTDLLSRLLPDLEPGLTELATRLKDNADPGPVVPVHGDLHEAQLMVRDQRITGLLDVDTVGLGYRIDDWATFIGHLATRLDAAPRPVRFRIEEYGRQVIRIADNQVDPVALRKRVAAVIIAMATGPFRAQTASWPADTRQRIAVAKEWWQSAESLSSKAQQEIKSTVRER